MPAHDGGRACKVNGCPGCGRPGAPRRTGGPVVCPNCGHRGSRTWTHGDEAEATEGEDQTVRVRLDAPSPSFGDPGSHPWRPN